MNVAVVGTGYVGLVAGTCFADTGNQVTCVDIDLDKIKRLESGDPVIYEQGLEFLLKKNIKEKRIHFTNDLGQAVEDCTVIFMAVGTPSADDGSANLTYLEAAARAIGRFMNGYRVVVNKSTVPVGTAQLVNGWIAEELKKRGKGEISFDVVSNPEFLKEGTAVQDFQRPDRVVIGTSSEKALDIMKELYTPFFRTSERFQIMDNISAEITKYAANCFLATKISFMNQMAVLCDRVGGDIEKVRSAMGSDPRIGDKFLFPGIGYGGSCFPKDVKALIHTGQQLGSPMSILTEVEEVNKRQKTYLLPIIKKHFESRGSKLAGKTFGVWGLSFKPGTDDIREAPSVEMITELLKLGVQIRVFDPVAIDNVRLVFGDKIIYGEDPYSILRGADALLIHTEWSEFRLPDFDGMKSLMNSPLIFDGRNLFTRASMKKHGLIYYSVGRPAVIA
jgi:UDPglucose 6-dehydrogenase